MESPRTMSPIDWGKAIAVGLLNGIALAVILIATLKSGVSPMPAPLGLLFADTLFGRHLPVPVGVAFHLAYVTFWSVVFIVFFRPRLAFSSALLLAAGLWIFALLVFVPFVGWGFFGMAFGPRIAIGLLVNHVLFALFLWGLSKAFFRHEPRPDENV
ncbi:MAG: hypothetical protein KGL63_07580 [Betaproteobacteria bacterium]|nr:hypothetical protein [Betaproteobacteria bacterium]